MQTAMVYVQTNVDGLDMGVLGDGTPYLSSRALARVCGVAPSVIIELTQRWDPGALTKREQIIMRLLLERGHDGDALAVRATKDGKPVNAHPEEVCGALIEYYAFEAGKRCTHQAKEWLRTLSRVGLRELIYRGCGYNAVAHGKDRWRQFHDRMLLNKVPTGYFSVFQEISPMVLEAIRHGVDVGPKMIPDISVGMRWRKHWEAEGLAERYGPSKKYPHTYPDYFPQAAAKPRAHIYPTSALGEFRIWMEQVYLPKLLPGYLQRKVAKRALEAATVEELLAAVVPKRLPTAG